MISSSSLNSVFLISGAATPLGILLLVFARLTGRNSAVLFHGRDILTARRRPMSRILLMLSILLAGRVATNSRFTASQLPLRSSHVPTILYPGVDVHAVPWTSRASSDERRILFVGRLVKRKGADVLLRAFGMLHPSMPDVRLDIVGEGPEGVSLRALASGMGLDGVVEFHGELRGRDLWEKYANASLFVMPPKEPRDDVEGFGTVYLEAGLFGVPCIGTRVGGVPEAILEGRTGILVEPDDAEGLRDAIVALLNDPVKRQWMGENARARAAAFSWENGTRKVLSLFSGDLE